MINKEQLKQALYSVLIGFAISILTILFQATLEWLNGLQYATGPTAGIGFYLAKGWRYIKLV